MSEESEGARMIGLENENNCVINSKWIKKAITKGNIGLWKMVLEKRSGKRYVWIDERLCGLLDISTYLQKSFMIFYIKEFIKVIMDMWILPLTTLLEVKIG